MFPELTSPLLVGVAVAAAFVAFLVIRRPVLRRLALRQVARRPTEALLVVLGSVLGTALIVASLVVGDSLDRSGRQVAYDVLGPVDEYVRSPSLAQGDEVAARLQAWRQIALSVEVTLLASLLATIGPARRAASIRPAIAVRVAD